MDVWNQIRADVLGLEVNRLPVAEATLLGTALFCRAAVDNSRPLDELAEWIIGGKTYLPNDDATNQYKRLFELFDQFVQNTSKIYEDLRALQA